MDEPISYRNDMSGEDYEKFCGRYLVSQKFTIIKYTPVTDDYGADIVAKDPYGNIWVFQCKRYSDSVGKEAVQEVVASKPHYHADCAGVITNSQLTKGAKILARDNNVTVFEHISPESPNHRTTAMFSDEPSGAIANWALVFAILIITAPIGFAMALSYLRQDGHARKGKAITAIVISVGAIIWLIAGIISSVKSCQTSHQEESIGQESRVETTTKTEKQTSKETETERETKTETETETETETTVTTILYTVIVNTGRIRKGPGTDTDTICLVYFNDELEGTGNSEKVGNTIWYEVYYNDSGETGWASEIIISPVE